MTAFRAHPDNTAGRGRLFDSILDTVGDTPAIRINNLGAGPRHDLCEGGVLQSGRLGQGQAGAQHHRGGRAQRRAEAGPDRRRGDERQHRHRPRHGLRAEGLSAGRHHGRQFLGRTPQADAHAGRQGGADAARPERLRHVSRRRSNWPRPMAGSWPASSRPRPTPTFTRRRRRARSSTISRGSRLDWFVTGYGTGGTVVGVARVLRRERPETRIVLCEPANAQLDRQRQGAGARGRRCARRPATPPSSRTRSRAGRRISSRPCCRKRSTSTL